MMDERKIMRNKRQLLRNRLLTGLMALVVMFTTILPTQQIKADDSLLPAATNISFDKARTISFDSTISEEVSDGDNVRYYAFKLNSASEIIIRGTCAYWNSVYSHFYIYDETRTEVYSFGVGNGFSESFYLTGGKYYIKYESGHNISFLVTANTLSESFKETQTKNNDMIGGASSINVKKTYKGVLTSNDEIDYYKFNVPANGTINFSMTNPSDCNLKYSIYDTSLNLVYVNTVNRGKKASEYIKMKKGNFYLALTKVDSSSGGGSYKFSVDYAAEKPSKPTISSVKNSSSKKMTVKWKKVSGITGYELQYSTDKNFKSGVTKKTIASSKTSASYSKLKKGKTYYVRMRTYVTVNGTKTYSDWSAKKTVKISK